MQHADDRPRHDALSAVTVLCLIASLFFNSARHRPRRQPAALPDREQGNRIVEILRRYQRL
jgi:hypothetical protein